MLPQQAVEAPLIGWCQGGGVWSETRSALERHFGFRGFRPGQREAVASVLRARDALVVMPTGSGKSLCYQIPALVLPGVTLVVSPLIALMHDQVSALERCGVDATLVNSTLSNDEIHERLARAVAGAAKLLYVAPERFSSPTFRRALQRMRVSLVAIDEAHCVSEWGHDFRPSYLRLREVWASIGGPPLIALTATATPEVRRDIVELLGFRRPRVIVRGFDRPNLRWIVHREERLTSKSRILLSLLGSSAESSLVYASTRKMVEAATELLRGAGVDAAAYHAGLSRDQRSEVQESWTDGRIPTVVATSAFGMGIDKEDVRRVVHFQIPGSVEAYYQEAGRAGRDGEPAECVLLHSYRDRFTHEFFIRAAYPPGKTVRVTYRTLQRIARSYGGPVPAGVVAHRVPGATSEREVYSALRILTDAGVVEKRAGHPRAAAIDAGGSPSRREERPRHGYVPIDPTLEPQGLAFDWSRVAARRAFELRKLKRMERYAYQGGCRRRYLLRYFGEHLARSRCGACDRCG